MHGRNKIEDGSPVDSGLKQKSKKSSTEKKMRSCPAENGFAEFGLFVVVGEDRRYEGCSKEMSVSRQVEVSLIATK